MKILLLSIFCAFSLSLFAQEYEVSASNKVADNKHVLTYKAVQADSNTVTISDAQSNGMQAVNEFNQYSEVQKASYDAATGLITVVTSKPSELPQKIQVDVNQLNNPQEFTPDNSPSDEK